MADNDVQGQLDDIVRFLQMSQWKQFWDDAKVQAVSMAELGLDRRSPDWVIWETCQREQVVLFTGNRNSQSPESLEAAMRSLGRANSLPVITLSNPVRFGYDADYAERAAAKLLEYLVDLPKYLGTGRLYVP